jgi:tol-pal system protein YbgF
MRTFAWASIAVPLAALAAACGGGGDATQKQLDQLRNEVVKLRADNAALGERLEALELRSGGSGKKSGAAGEDRPSLDVVKLTPDGGSSDDPDAETARPVVRVTGAGGTITEEKGKGTGVPQRDFDEAVELYRTKKYDKALDAFTGFLARYPDNANAESAAFYRAECYFAKSDWRRAAEQYTALADRYPRGTKAADALFKLVQSQTRLGNKAAAEETKKKLLSNYPTSDAAKKLGGSTPGAKP